MDLLCSSFDVSLSSLDSNSLPFNNSISLFSRHLIAELLTFQFLTAMDDLAEVSDILGQCTVQSSSFERFRSIFYLLLCYFSPLFPSLLFPCSPSELFTPWLHFWLCLCFASPRRAHKDSFTHTHTPALYSNTHPHILAWRRSLALFQFNWGQTDLKACYGHLNILSSRIGAIKILLIKLDKQCSRLERNTSTTE